MERTQRIVKRLTLFASLAVLATWGASSEAAGTVRVSPGAHVVGVASRGGHHGGGGGHWGGGGSHHWGGHRWGYRSHWGSSWWWGWPYYDAYWGWGPRVYVYSGGVRVATSRYAAVKTDVEPDEAEVWLDGNYIGTADDFDGYPDLLYLEPGPYHLEFRLAGHKTYAVNVDVHRGERLKIDHHLDRESGHGRLESFSPPAKGMPNGRIYGKGGVPVTPNAPESRERTRVYQNHPGTDRDADMDDDEDVEVREGDGARAPEPPPAPRAPMRHDERSRIRWSVSPEDAAVYLDDAYVGTGEDLTGSHRGTFTEPGKHTVTIVRPGYQPQTVTVEVKPGQALDVVVKLTR